MWLKPSGVGGKGEGRCLERGPSLHQNHLELLQKKLKFIPVFLEGVVVLSKGRGAFNLHKYERTEKFY